MGRRSKGSRAAGRVRAVLVTLVALLVLAAAAAAALAWVAWRWVDAPLPLAAPTVAYTVAAGSTPRAVAAGWSKSGVDVDPRWLYAWFRLSGDASRIRAGHYEIAQGTTPRRLLEVMVQGLEALERVRLPEGQTLREWRAVLAASPHLVPDSAALDERALMAALDAPGLAAEETRAVFDRPEVIVLRNEAGLPEDEIARRIIEAARPGACEAQALQRAWRRGP